MSANSIVRPRSRRRDLVEEAATHYKFPATGQRGQRRGQLGGAQMKQLGRKRLRAEARAFNGGNVPLVRLALGHEIFLMDSNEALALAAQLVAAVDEVREGASDGR